MVLHSTIQNHTFLLDTTASRKLAVDLAGKFKSNKSCRKEVNT